MSPKTKGCNFSWRSVSYIVLGLVLLMGLCTSALAVNEQPAAGDKTNQSLVYELFIDSDIDGSLTSYVQRVYAAAEKDNASYVILHLNTYGGYVNTAVEIKQIIMGSPIDTICFVNDKAISAGALIALSCDQIIMSPGSTMGAAATSAEINGGESLGDQKVISFWSAELASAATSNGRDGNIAMSMADASIEIPEVIEKGKLLTLTSARAVELGMADGEAANRQVLLEEYGLENAVIVQVEQDFQEMLSGFLTNPAVAPILLAIGLGALAIELIFTGFGIAGFIGVLALTLYFTGGLLAGYASWLAIVFLFVGLILLVLEIFVIPGFGVAGGIGIVCLFGSIIAVAPSFGVAIGQILFALVIMIVLVVVSLKFGKTRRVWGKLILNDKTSTEGGYISQPQAINDYTGKEGVAITDLRPAGAADIDGQRVDVVTEGNFITAGKRVVVLKVDGSSVIVRQID